jgi:hypothetical protein
MREPGELALQVGERSVGELVRELSRQHATRPRSQKLGLSSIEKLARENAAERRQTLLDHGVVDGRAHAAARAPEAEGDSGLRHTMQPLRAQCARRASSSERTNGSVHVAVSGPIRAREHALAQGGAWRAQWDLSTCQSA